MPMKIKIKLDSFIALPSNSFNKLTQRSNFRKHKFIQSIELSIEIFATVAGPKIARNDTIRVQHGHNIENEHRSEGIRRLTIL